MKRRRFLCAGAAALGSTLVTPGCAGGPNVRGEAWQGRVLLTQVRRLQAVRIDPLTGRCAYVAQTANGTFIQPVFHARSGETCEFVFENRLPQPTTLHPHGLLLPEDGDGAGFDPVLPGQTRRVRFTLRNRAGLYWMHAHAHGFTAEQVHAGLAALLVVHDPEDDALDAALQLASANRLALALADARVAGDTLLPYAPSPVDCLHGWFGNRMRVNGELEPAFEVAPGWVRLQLLNACNARGLFIGMEDPSRAGELQTFHLLGVDGGLLEAPKSVERLFLYGAERVDIAVALAPGAKRQVTSLAFDPRHQMSGHPVGHAHAARAGYRPLAAAEICAEEGAVAASLPDGARLPLFTLQAGTLPQKGEGRLPLRLSSLGETVLPASPPTRRLRLDFDEKHGFLIDNQPYRIDESGIIVTRGAREVWEIRNSPISMPHAIHLHAFGFRVLRRQGTFGPARALAREAQGRLPSDLGIKDTVVVWPNETLWIEIDFSLPRDEAFRGRQRYMLHCHNLEHEDGMMMRNITLS